jgi:WD40 repeat protein
VTTANRFAFHPSGRVLVVFDGKELLVHGKEEAPLWKRQMEGDILGIAAFGDAVVTLEAGGKISWWSAANGDPLGSATTGGNVLALASARGAAACLAVLPGGVEIAEQGKELRSLPFPGNTTAAALRDDGSRIAVGSEDGAVTIVTADGTPVGTSKLDGAVTSLCWTPAGFWIATWGERIVRVDADGGPPKPITRAGGMAPDCVCASSDGTLFAMRLDARTMMSYGYPPGAQVVQLQYFDREVAGVAFGPGRRLGVGLLGGDGNVADIPSGQLYRTDTFPGRKHNSWLVNMNIDPSAAPTASPPAAAASPRAAPSPDASALAAAPPARNLRRVLAVVAILVVIGIAVALSR